MSDGVAKILDERFRLGVPADVLRVPKHVGGLEGFFRHGQLTLYGRNSLNIAAPSAGSELVDVDSRDNLLPFNPSDVINNLRLENYLPRLGSKKFGTKAIVRQLYYTMRPLFPVSFRKHLQKRFLDGWQDIPFPSWPVDLTVDKLLVKLLEESMIASGVDSIPFIWFWPDGLNGCVTITHDVETAVGRDYTLELAALDLQHGFTPAFQLIPELRYEVEPGLRTALQELGAEINIHGLSHDGHLFDSKEVFLERVEKINRYGRDFGARGFRSPVLYRNPDWFKYLEFDYEMSLPNVGHLDPQRGGCCTVFPFAIGDILEIPLTTIQDYSLFHVVGDYSIDLWRQQLEIIVRANGIACFNIHPDYIISSREHNVYLSLLEYLQQEVTELRLWATTPGEIASWWKQRAAMEIKKENGSWIVRGQGSERASVAHARLTTAGIVFGSD